jgi:gamma-glutamyltranspeptidase/glutathione hydrolase
MHSLQLSMKNRLIALLSAGLLAACTVNGRPPSESAQSAPTQPERASGYSAKAGWNGKRFAVAAANPLATAAGFEVLQAGGSAVDAAIAVQMVLALVEPQSSGIGGGAFLLHFNGKQVEAFDGRETAPAAATEKLFIGADGKPMSFAQAVVGRRAVGTPGTVPMLEMAHQQYGRLPWARLMQPAITLARQGFAVSQRLHTLLAAEQRLKQDPVAAAYFYDPAGQPWPVGHVLKNPELAEILQRVAREGSRALNTGDIAQATVSKVQGHASNPGGLSLADLAGYQPKLRMPLCHDYSVRERDYRLCGMPPPSSGALAVGQILGLLSHTDAGNMLLNRGLPGADWLHLYTEAARLTFADRAQYVADPDFVQPPAGSWMSLLNPTYLAERARQIGPRAMDKDTVRAGLPGKLQSRLAPMPAQPEYGTSHISVIDAQGNAVAMTTTIEDAFGARQMVNRGRGLAGGFLLNNELTDFSFVPRDASGAPIANRVQPGKRPRSSMSPTLVFDKATGRLVMSTGSPGGAFIIHFTAKTLYGVLNWGMTPQQAIDLPNFGALDGTPLLLEEQRFAPATAEALKARGHTVRELPLTSGLQAIQQTAQGLSGGADPRREGVVMGE